MTQPLLQVQNLCKRFGALEASRDLSFDVAAGELHALIGPNGAGKTTLVNQLAGELRPDSGTIRYQGKDVTRLPVYRRAQIGIARSFQVTSVFERLTLAQNMALAIQAHQGHSFRFWRPAARDLSLVVPALAALEQVGLAERANEPAAALSHGEKKQLEVGMVLAARPRLLLLDEPMAGMGPGGTLKLSQLIRQLKGELTILLVEHDMDVVFALADRITVLDYGQAIITGTPDQVRASPAVQQAYLGGEGQC
jgi:branched-chain amino acid transport system ATP-binding protein